MRGVSTSRAFRYFNRHEYIPSPRGSVRSWGVRAEISRWLPAKVLSRLADLDDVVARCLVVTTLVRPRLEARTHCKAFLMTEEILSYTHPFRTPRYRDGRFVPGVAGAAKDLTRKCEREHH